MGREDIKMLVNKWWDVYNDESLDYEQKNTTTAGINVTCDVEDGGHTKLGPFASALANAGIHHKQTAAAPSAA